MSKFEEGMKILNERFGNNKDNINALATISQEPDENGLSRPCVRDVDAFYEDGEFFIVTYALSGKMKQISANPNVSITVHLEDFFSSGIGINRGWVMEPDNAELRGKLRNAFKDWYDFANNEEDKNCCILAVHMTHGTLRIDHGAMFFHFDFDSKTAT